MNTKQIIVIVIVVALMGGLLARPIKGVVDENTGANDSATATSSSAFNFLSVSEITKQSINANIAQEVNALGADMAQAGGRGRLVWVEHIAQTWDAVA